MTDEEILAEFRASDALLEGHFILSSGLRSPRYLQCARVLMDGTRAERLARALAAKLPPAIVERLAKETNAFLAQKKVQDDFASDGVVLQGSTPQKFTDFQRADQQRWRAVLEKAGLAAR